MTHNDMPDDPALTQEEAVELFEVHLGMPFPSVLGVPLLLEELPRVRLAYDDTHRTWELLEMRCSCCDRWFPAANFDREHLPHCTSCAFPHRQT